MSKRNRTKAKRVARSTRRVKLHELSKLITPKSLEPQFLREARVREDLPVHYGGSISNIDPRYPEGSRLRHEAMQEAHKHLNCRAAHGLDSFTTVQMLEPNGWIVRNWHGPNDDHIEPDSRIADIDKTAQSSKRNHERRQMFEQSNLDVILKNKALRERRRNYDFEHARQTLIMMEL
jgi:hypothetical protein